MTKKRAEDDAAEEAANQRAIERVRKGATEDAGDETAAEVEIDEDDDEDEPPARPESPEERSSRKEKRRERGRQREEERQQFARENAELKERLARLEGHISAQRQVPQTEQRPTENPIDAEIKKLIARQRQLATTINELPEHAQRQHLPAALEENDAIEDQLVKLRIQKYAPPPPVVPNRAELLIDSEAPDIRQHPQGLAVTRSAFDMIVQAGKMPAGPEALRAAIAQARDILGIRKAAPVRSRTENDSLRSRLGGAPRSAGGAPDKGSSVAMTRAMERIAKAAYPKLSQAEANKKWAQKHGRRFNEEED